MTPTIMMAAEGTPRLSVATIVPQEAIQAAQVQRESYCQRCKGDREDNRQRAAVNVEGAEFPNRERRAEENAGRNQESMKCYE